MTSPLNLEQQASVTGEVDGAPVVLTMSSTSREVAEMQAGAGVADLSHVHTVRLCGPDARRFANGMFTNNIRDMKPGESIRSAMCDDRGRVQGLIDVLCTAEDAFDGILEGVTAEWFEARYGLYIVFDDVEMEVFEADPWVLTVQGPQTMDILAAAGLPRPATGHHVRTDSGILVTHKDRTGLGGVDLLIPSARLSSTYQALVDAGAFPVGFLALEHLRIGHGRPRWPVDGTEKSMIHELRIDREVCSFNKGCYLGQEVINRVDVKGQVNKMIHRILVDAPPDELPGAPVHLGEEQVGTITSAAPTDHGTVGLAVLRKSAWTNGQAVKIALPSGTVEGEVQSLT